MEQVPKLLACLVCFWGPDSCVLAFCGYYVSPLISDFAFQVPPTPSLLSWSKLVLQFHPLTPVDPWSHPLERRPLRPAKSLWTGLAATFFQSVRFCPSVCQLVALRRRPVDLLCERTDAP